MATTVQTQTAASHELVSPAQWETQSLEAGPQPPEAKPTSGLSKGTYLKILSAGFSFFTAGVNDGSMGALIPHIIRDYEVTTAIVSSV
jgi:hypothetical protein